MGEMMFPPAGLGEGRPCLGGWIPEVPGRYPGRPGVSVEEWCGELLAMPSAEARGFYVSLWLNDAVKRGVSRGQVVDWVGHLARRWPEASEILGAISTTVQEA